MWSQDELMLLSLIEDLHVGVGVADLCLVDPSPCLYYALLFVLIAGFVVNGEFSDNLASA